MVTVLFVFITLSALAVPAMNNARQYSNFLLEKMGKGKK